MVGHQVPLVVGAQEVEAHPVADVHDVEVPEAARGLESEHLAEEPRRRLGIAGVDHVVVQLDGHPPIIAPSPAIENVEGSRSVSTTSV